MRTPVDSAPPEVSVSGLRASVLALAQGLADDGFQLVRPVEEGFLAPSSRATTPMTIAPRTCLAVVAVATPSMADLDAGLYASDGSALADDEASDARPMLRLCTGAAEVRGYLSLFAFQGAGSYALAQLSRPARSSDTVLSAGPDGAGSAAFFELLRGLRARGYEDEGPSTEVPLTAGAPLHLASKVLAGQCYSVVADGPLLRVRLLDESGREVALGVGEHGPAALQYCASRTGSFTLELSGSDGTRSAQLVRMRAPQTTVGGALSTWLGEPAVRGRLPSPRPYPAHPNAKQASCTRDEQHLWKRAELSQGNTLWAELAPSKSRCELVEVTLHEGLSRATLSVATAEQGTLSEHELLAGAETLRVCGEGQSLLIMVVGRAGFGTVSVTRRGC